MKNKITKYIAPRLIALLMFPYSASAAAACNTPLDYSAAATPDIAYEAAAYQTGGVQTAHSAGTAAEAQAGAADLPSLSDRNAISL